MPGWNQWDFSGDWNLNFGPAALQLQTGLVRAGEAPVDIDIRYYIRNRATPSLMSARNHLWNLDWQTLEQHNLRRQVHGATMPLHEGVIDFDGKRRLVWSTYWIDGRFATSSLLVRLLEFQAGISHGHSAVVAFSTPITSSVDDARARLQAVLDAFPDLSGELSKAGDLPAAPR